MASDAEDRISVVAGATSVGVTLTLGDVTVSVHAPAPAGAAQLTAEQMRVAALRVARRALEVALKEMNLAGG